MRPKTLILFIVAIACGLVASIGVSQYMEKAKGAASVVSTTKIYVATTEVSPTERLDASNVSLEEWPSDRVPDGAITDLKQLEGKHSRSRMYKGEPILAVKLSDSLDGSVSLSIKEGYRVVAVKVDENSSGGGLIRSGDRVDLVLFLRKSADVPETTTRTILWDVNVFAVGGVVERDEDKNKGSAREVRTVSLLVTPKQAESVMLAKELGVLSLSLRRPGDTQNESAGGETVRTLLGQEGEIVNENKRKPQAPVDTAPVPPPTVVDPPAFVEPPIPPEFTMRIRTSTGDQTFFFPKLFGPPQEPEGTPAPGQPKSPSPPKGVTSIPFVPVNPIRPTENPPAVRQDPGELEPYPAAPSSDELPLLTPTNPGN